MFQLNDQSRQLFKLKKKRDQLFQNLSHNQEQGASRGQLDNSNKENRLVNMFNEMYPEDGIESDSLNKEFEEKTKRNVKTHVVKFIRKGQGIPDVISAEDRIKVYEETIRSLQQKNCQLARSNSQRSLKASYLSDEVRALRTQLIELATKLSQLTVHAKAMEQELEGSRQQSLTPISEEEPVSAGLSESGFDEFYGFDMTNRRMRDERNSAYFDNTCFSLKRSNADEISNFSYINNPSYPAIIPHPPILPLEPNSTISTFPMISKPKDTSILSKKLKLSTENPSINTEKEDAGYQLRPRSKLNYSYTNLVARSLKGSKRKVKSQKFK